MYLNTKGINPNDHDVKIELVGMCDGGGGAFNIYEQLRSFYHFHYEPESKFKMYVQPNIYILFNRYILRYRNNDINIAN